MTTYALYQETGRNRDKKKLYDFAFVGEPVSGDTVDINDEQWTIGRKHWKANGRPILIIRKSSGLVLA